MGRDRNTFHCKISCLAGLFGSNPASCGPQPTGSYMDKRQKTRRALLHVGTNVLSLLTGLGDARSGDRPPLWERGPPLLEGRWAEGKGAEEEEYSQWDTSEEGVGREHHQGPLGRGVWGKNYVIREGNSMRREEQAFYFMLCDITLTIQCNIKTTHCKSPSAQCKTTTKNIQCNTTFHQARLLRVPCIISKDSLAVRTLSCLPLLFYRCVLYFWVVSAES